MENGILIVDDDPAVVASLALLLKQEGFRSQGASSPPEALNFLERGPYGLVLQDMNFSRRTDGAEGLELLQRIRAKHPRIPVVLITAWGSISLAVRGMRAGATDFITKPWSNQQIVHAIKTALGLAEAFLKPEDGLPVRRTDMDSRYDYSKLIGESPSFLHVLDIAGRVSPTDASVLITGESGSGKELLAEAIHRNSNRRTGPFVKVNLGGISTPLFESEMFGHVKGAFTDAILSRKGRFALADGGTIFLDEIGDLDPGCQVKLLRVLQDRTYEVLGSSETRTVDVRVISATNRNLPEMIESGQFREDLLYRLNLITLTIPPLRERTADIPLLVRDFIDVFGKEYQRSALSVTDRAMHWLQAQKWPGNVRELRQLVERTVLLFRSDTLDAADFQQAFDMRLGEMNKMSSPDFPDITIEEMERLLIEKSLSRFGNNVTLAAENLGISQAALYRRLKKYGISP